MKVGVRGIFWGLLENTTGNEGQAPPNHKQDPMGCSGQSPPRVKGPTERKRPAPGEVVARTQPCPRLVTGGAPLGRPPSSRRLPLAPPSEVDVSTQADKETHVHLSGDWAVIQVQD